MDKLRARRREEKDQRRQQILDAARALFASQGVDATTIEQITNACRLSRSLVYTYFIDKKHIFLVVVAEALEVLLAEFEQAMIGQPTALDRVSALGRAYVSFAQSRPDYYDATLRFQLSKDLQPNRDVTGKPVLVERLTFDFNQVVHRADQINQLFARQIELGMAEGSIRRDIGPPLQVALSLWAMTGGLIQTSTANAQWFSQAYGISQSSLIDHGLALARAGLIPKAGHA